MAAANPSSNKPKVKVIAYEPEFINSLDKNMNATIENSTFISLGKLTEELKDQFDSDHYEVLFYLFIIINHKFDNTVSTSFRSCKETAKTGTERDRKLRKCSSILLVSKSRKVNGRPAVTSSASNWTPPTSWRTRRNSGRLMATTWNRWNGRRSNSSSREDCGKPKFKSTSNANGWTVSVVTEMCRRKKISTSCVTNANSATSAPS